MKMNSSKGGVSTMKKNHHQNLCLVQWVPKVGRMREFESFLLGRCLNDIDHQFFQEVVDTSRSLAKARPWYVRSRTN
jgi:hypothetical protein